MKKNKKIKSKKPRAKKTVIKKAKKLIKKIVKAIKSKPKAKKEPVVKKVLVKEVKTPFDRAQLEEFKEKLINLKDDVMAQIRDISETTLGKSQKELSGDMSGYSLHIADVASDNYDRDFNLGLVSGERRIALEIEEALKKIEDKTFGICEACKKPVIKTRLNAIPYAKLCIKCKELSEKNEPQRDLDLES